MPHSRKASRPAATPVHTLALPKPALQAALRNGLAWFEQASGIRLPPIREEELIAHQLAAIARAARREDAPNVQTVTPDPRTRWWDL